MASRIEDYAVIGDCETAALVSRDGSLDWLCWPNFSSPACFAALLGDESNGRWRIAPETTGEMTVTRRYRPRTLILETTFEMPEGAVTLVDFMPVRRRNSDVVRIVRGVRGRVSMCMELTLRMDYGLTVPWVTRIPRGLKAVAGPDMLVLRTSAPLRGEGLKTVGEFSVSAGESVAFVLTYGPSHEHEPRAIDPQQALVETERFWTEWTGRCRIKGKYAEAVERSLITLKALTYRPTGGVVAAVTTSLPEMLGGQRNWDYRYCWLRDATFTLLALMEGGYHEEARAWQDWLLRAIAGSADQVQIMYGLAGERQLVEWEVGWLPGYEQSRPVRVGNAAAGQVQLDIYGEVMDAFFHSRSAMESARRADFDLHVSLLRHLEQVWRQPDQGIWESRGGPQQFTYSKVMVWVAFDRAIRSAQRMAFPAPIERWTRLRDEIHAEVCERAYDAKRNCFVQSYDSEHLDAALLLIPVLGFLPPEDPRVPGTIEAIEKHLMRDGFVMRYDTGKVDDGLPPGEGAFLACSFWMVGALEQIGRVKDAHALFERLLSLRNDVGLLAEEYDVQRKRQVGNFPQAFSHISLIHAAVDLMNGDAALHRRTHAQNTHEER